MSRNVVELLRHGIPNSCYEVDIVFLSSQKQNTVIVRITNLLYSDRRQQLAGHLVSKKEGRKYVMYKRYPWCNNKQRPMT